MSRTMWKMLLIPVLLFSLLSGHASAQDKAAAGDERVLNGQEVIDLIAGKKVTYRSTAGNTGSFTPHQVKTTFTKTGDAGGTLVAYADRSSSGGTWTVNENGRLIRQYESVRWGDKPFPSRIVEKGGKYYIRIGATEDHEIVSIE